MTVSRELEEEEADEFDATGLVGLDGKKHLKMPSACHLVAWAKLTHTSMRPGRLNAGSRRSIWFVVANNSLQKMGRLVMSHHDEEIGLMAI